MNVTFDSVHNILYPDPLLSQVNWMFVSYLASLRLKILLASHLNINTQSKMPCVMLFYFRVRCFNTAARSLSVEPHFVGSPLLFAERVYIYLPCISCGHFARSGGRGRNSEFGFQSFQTYSSLCRTQMKYEASCRQWSVVYRTHTVHWHTSRVGPYKYHRIYLVLSYKYPVKRLSLRFTEQTSCFSGKANWLWKK